MSFNISNSSVNLNANAIFQSLDTRDGSADSKIQASIWNQFAEITGGNHIKNYITEKNAIRSIRTYLARATEEVKNKICDFFGWGTQEDVQKKVNDAESLMQEANKSPSNVTIEESECSEEYKSFGYVKMKTATLQDGRYIDAYYNNEGEITMVRVSTDTSTHKFYDGQKYDGEEVNFCDDGVRVSGNTDAGYNEDINGSTDCYAYKIEDNSYQFQKYKALAEKIFGETNS